jgi:hypothetical protein
MAARLGNVLYWLGCIVATLFLAGLLWTWIGPLEGHPRDGDWLMLGAFFVFAVVSWAIGRGLRYILAGV